LRRAYGDLSDRYGRCPVLIFSLAGTVASFRDAGPRALDCDAVRRAIVVGLSGGNISTARAYVRISRSRCARAWHSGAAFGLGFIFGPALSGLLARVSYTCRFGRAGITVVATIMAWLWLPETVHRVHAGTGNPLAYLPELLKRPIIRRVLAIDFVFWFALAIFQTTFGLFVAARFGFGPGPTGYLFAGFGLLGAIVQGGFIRPIVRRFGDKTTSGPASSQRNRAGGRPSRTPSRCSCSSSSCCRSMGFGMPTISSLAVARPAHTSRGGARRERD
jgi:DHA1 family tetracycline resistance protein-like MFS transporter